METESPGASLEQGCRPDSGAVGLSRRERLKRLLLVFGHDTVRYHAQQLLYRALSDLDRVPAEVLEMLAKEVVSDWRFSQKLNRQNRMIGGR